MSLAEKSKQICDNRQVRTVVVVTVAVKLACAKDIATAKFPTEYSQSFSEWLVCLWRTSVVTSDFNHPSKEHINYISSGLSAEILNTQNDGQNSG